jgi:Tfp pilus assembly protein PilO
MLLDRLAIYPIFSKIDELNKEIQKKEADIKKNLRILSHKDNILEERQKYANFLSDSKSEEEEMTSILKSIEELASESFINLVDMKPMGLKTSDSSKRYVINLNCEARMGEIVEFMYAIENSTKLLSIEKYKISPKSKESTMASCSITIFKIVMP